MARILTTNFGFITALDNGVGPGTRNARDDVGIVQFALAVLTRGLPGPLGNAGAKFSVPGQSPIGIDGGFGPQTAAYIKAYQEFRRASPGPGGGPLPPVSGTFRGFHASGSWPFSVLDEDACRASSKRLLADALAADGQAPLWLKHHFLG
ncbi:MAG: hypothetical protein KGQ77_04210 [Betaproteobacteria bacterium]|nr:hypothetical protein [Betaproteobacteria bacterium]